ncbi:MacB family efflux pump subunit [Pelagibacterium lacus]|uniref:Pyoverdine export ATP-binding/permease protein PvdT n=1 Tax=Pelagibacterium lacus TaxID=2282655 RepID=A0A369W0K7_9HYPH|nr:MacB family efflux pump subunit [Pelagibacterium lacus]RDE08204.1 MacB family efflux pump subunit [Pelagibacterium lacus]
MSQPIISIRKLRREYQAGDEKLAVLKDVDLDVHAGEMVAIIGQSGSGKSTLMNVLGCLDDGWTGSYTFAGKDVRKLSADGLAELRREHFGFIFQRYQLLTELDAVENVEVPAVYAGADRKRRRQRAADLLTRLGLGERLSHKPSELSGGQQQRVSVARALMNGGEVILADEPTGALDSRSGTELMALLQELHGEGHTIIIVTHDPEIAAQCQRVVEIKDGVIISDTAKTAAVSGRAEQAAGLRRAPLWRGGIDRFGEAFSMAVRAMGAHRLRTFLTMLGIIIGIASVVSVVALGQGSQQQVLESISAIGTNTINIMPGTSAADRRAGNIRTLVPADAEALAAESFADSVTPQVSSSQRVGYRNVSANASVSGVGADYFRVNGRTFITGVTFNQTSVDTRSQEAILDETAAQTLFGDSRSALGQVIILGNVPVRVIGVIEDQTLGFGFGNQLNVWLPYTTVMSRMLGQRHLSAISVRLADTVDATEAENLITAILRQRHGVVDFTLQNTDTIRETIQSTTQTLTLLISAIALISLVVGGIGVMNIMLVSVSERTKEIGVRMAIGARQADIMQQFLIEAVLVCIIGGLAGVGLSFAFGQGLTALMPDARLDYSLSTIVAAFISSSLIGIVFGFMPARSAARLDPVDALARE